MSTHRPTHTVKALLPILLGALVCACTTASDTAPLGGAINKVKRVVPIKPLPIKPQPIKPQTRPIAPPPKVKAPAPSGSIIPKGLNRGGEEEEELDPIGHAKTPGGDGSGKTLPTGSSRGPGKVPTRGGARNSDEEDEAILTNKPAGGETNAPGDIKGPGLPQVAGNPLVGPGAGARPVPRQPGPGPRPSGK